MAARAGLVLEDAGDRGLRSDPVQVREQVPPDPARGSLDDHRPSPLLDSVPCCLGQDGEEEGGLDREAGTGSWGRSALWLSTVGSAPCRPP